MTDKKVDNLIINKLTKAQYDAIQEKSDTELYLVPDDIVTAQWGVVSQTQTWTQASDGGYDYTMSDLQYGWIPQANIDLYEAAGAVFNEQSGYFELNGLTDISYEEMQSIYYVAGLVNGYSWGSNTYAFRSNKNIRTIPKVGNGSVINSSYSFSSCTNLEVLATSGQFNIGDTRSMFIYCSHLKTIKHSSNGALVLGSSQSIGDMFKGCVCLESLKLKNLNKSIDFSNSLRLSTESIVYMINNTGTSTLTITLHPTAYARAIADSDVQAALQAHTNVSLASAT